MNLFHRHKWTKWEVIEAGRGEYVFGGEDARYFVQQRQCLNCGKKQMERVVA